MVITDLLRDNALKLGDEISLVEINPDIEDCKMGWEDYDLVETDPTNKYRREMTWREFDDKANRLANFLMDRGMGRGQKVAMLLMNSLEWLPIYFGILKAGAVVVPLNYRYTAEEIKYCLDLAECDAILFGPEFKDRIEEIKDQLTRVKMKLFVGQGRPAFSESYYALTACCSAMPPKIKIEKDWDGAIYFSSGTTGFPKAILHDHESLITACVVEQKHHGQTRDDVFLCIPPLYHTGGKMHWFGSLLAGGRGIILKGTNPHAIMKTVSEEKASVVFLLVPWAQDILDEIDAGRIKMEELNLSQWRLMHIGAQPVPPSLIHRWQEYFPGQEYDTNYGLSESIGPGCVHLGVENIHKAGAIGKAGFSWKTKIVDGDGQPVKQGDVGELAVAGPGVMKCYYRNKKASDEVLKNGWLHTGDMAKEDEEGFIYLVDRKKDVIISGGENIYPVQIENFLRSHKAIKDAAVIGIQDQRLGEIAAAIIELKAGETVTEEDLFEFSKELPRYKRPKKIIFDIIPRNPTGKIEKPKLRERYAGLNLVEAQTKA